jgi:hypothetical protein
MRTPHPVAVPTGNAGEHWSANAAVEAKSNNEPQSAERIALRAKKTLETSKFDFMGLLFSSAQPMVEAGAYLLDPSKIELGTNSKNSSPTHPDPKDPGSKIAARKLKL